MSFSVVSKRTGITYEVFAVKDNHFLIFFNGNFSWQSMSQFRPTKKTEQERLSSEEDKKPMFRKQQREQVTYP